MEAETTPAPRSATFHLALNQDMDESVLEAMLKRAGIPVHVLRTVTQLHEGIAFTHLLAEAEWDQSSGADRCGGGCHGQDEQHRRYHQLSKEQRDEFHRDMGKGLDYYRINLYSLSDGSFRDMAGVAMDDCEPQETAVPNIA